MIAIYTECHLDQPVTIGKLLPNYHCDVLDEKMQEVPVGEFGELYLEEPDLARDYVNRDELTKSRFVSSEFADRLYKTGV